MLNRLSFVAIGEEGCDFEDALLCGKGSADQALPCRGVTAREGLLKLIYPRLQGLKLTKCAQLAALLDVGELPGPSTAASKSITSPLTSG